MFARIFCFLLLVAFVACALIAADRSWPVVVDNHTPGRWDFNNVDYPVCFTVKPPPLLRSPRDTPYQVGKKYNNEGVV